MRKHRWLATFLLTVLIGSPALARVHMREVVTFGDSLTQNDFLHLASGTSQSLYGADPMEAVFDKEASTFGNLTSYAVVGFESGDLGTQLDAYEFANDLGVQHTATLFHVEIGGNDILNNINSLAAHPPGRRLRVDAIITDLVINIRKNLRRLHGFNPSAQVIIWTVPDVTLTPKEFNALTGRGRANVRAHIERANAEIMRLGRFPFVAVIDIYRLMQEFATRPPLVFGQQLVPPPFFGGFDHIFADEIHPTAVSNALIANEIIKKINLKFIDNIPTYTRRELARRAHITPPP